MPQAVEKDAIGRLAIMTRTMNDRGDGSNRLRAIKIHEICKKM